MKKIIILFLLLLLVSCSKEGKEEVSTNQSEAEFVSTNQSDNQFIIFDKTTKFTFRTIEYYGIVYDPDSDRISHYIELGIPLPFLPKVALEIPPKPQKLNLILNRENLSRGAYYDFHGTKKKKYVPFLLILLDHLMRSQEKGFAHQKITKIS